MIRLSTTPPTIQPAERSTALFSDGRSVALRAITSLKQTPEGIWCGMEFGMGQVPADWSAMQESKGVRLDKQDPRWSHQD